MRNYLYLLVGIILIFPYHLFAQNIKVEKLPASVNSNNYGEISPLLSTDGKTLFFTRIGFPEFNKTLLNNGRDISTSLSSKEYDENLKSIFSKIAGTSIQNVSQSKYNQDIWTANLYDDKIGAIQHPSAPLNNALPNSICSLAPDGNSYIIINQFSPEGGMRKGFSVIKRLGADAWTFPKPIKIENYYTSHPDVGISMSPDGEVLITSLRRDDTFGSTDLYVSFKTGENTWGVPQSLGSNINSNKKEMTPFISEDKQLIFFASDKGGSTDLYVSQRLDDSWTNWTKPKRLTAPINSKAKESHPFFHSASGYLYFCSNRDGSSDIFRVKILPPKSLAGMVKIKGRIINAKTGQQVSSRFFSFSNKNTLTKKHYTRDGYFEFNIPKSSALTLQASKEGFICQEQKLSFLDINLKDREVFVKLYITPKEEGEKLYLKNIKFEQSKAVILSSSFSQLKQLIKTLKIHPNIYLRIEGHTDNQGKDYELLDLSQKRAEAVKAFLVQNGISPVRLETIGYGAAKPLNENATDFERKKNRRVEFVIAKVSEAMASNMSEKTE